jgi:predicted DCC family thiol-disulfide oxidoreductase YuxK
MEIADIKNPVILFDGVCNLCSSSVQFIIKHDKKNLFTFASLQSELGKRILQQFDLPTEHFNSFILYQHGRIYTKSTGALMVAKQLTGAWPILYGFIIIPPIIRNSVYNFVANNRYKWFGKQEACWLPLPHLRAKFLDT